MQSGTLRTAVIAIAVVIVATSASASDETISIWSTGMTPVSLSMTVGDTLDWEPFAAFHTADLTPAGLCDFTGATQLDTGGVGASYLFTSPGSYIFGCRTASHCATGGMSVTVEVSAVLAAPTLSPWAIAGTAIVLMGAIEATRRRMWANAFS